MNESYAIMKTMIRGMLMIVREVGDEESHPDETARECIERVVHGVIQKRKRARRAAR